MISMMTNEKKKEKLFGTDGVRGRANLYPMTVETAVKLGKAIALFLRRKQLRPRVVIGKDTRLSCYMFENALIAGLTSMGADTLMVGPLSTPGVAFITRAYRASAGIVISASHNPFYDNGIKIFTSEGFKLPDSVEEEMATMVAADDFSNSLPEDENLGRNKRISDSDGRYIEFVKATFPKGKNLNGFKIFLDCANGACHRVAPLVFSELDAELHVVGNEPNGLNINDNCGALHPELARKGVLSHQSDVGIALDGDGDRLILIDEQGNVVDGDTILAISAVDLKNRGELKNNRVVATVMTNLGVLQFLKEHGIEVILSKVGDRYVIQEMLSHDCFLGGEQSGHMIFLEHNTTGDGIVSALQVLRIMQQTKKPLSQLASSIKKYPQKLLNVRCKTKPPLEGLEQVQMAKNEVETQLGSKGRVLLRYSGTENLCRVLVEGPEMKDVMRFAEKIANAVKSEIGE
jgi:phosphoglucosamine mutase